MAQQQCTWHRNKQDDTINVSVKDEYCAFCWYYWKVLTEGTAFRFLNACLVLHLPAILQHGRFVQLVTERPWVRCLINWKATVRFCDLNVFQSTFRCVSGAYGWLTFNRILTTFLMPCKTLTTYSNALCLELTKFASLLHYITLRFCTILHMSCSENIIWNINKIYYLYRLVCCTGLYTTEKCTGLYTTAKCSQLHCIQRLCV